MNELMALKLCPDCDKALGDLIAADAKAQLEFLDKPVPEPPPEFWDNQQNQQDPATLVLTCEQHNTLAEIVENGNGQGAMMCDGCGSWDYMGIPSECYEYCLDIDDKLFRYLTAKDIKAAEVVHPTECDCVCCK